MSTANIFSGFTRVSGSLEIAERRFHLTLPFFSSMWRAVPDFDVSTMHKVGADAGSDQAKSDDHCYDDQNNFDRAASAALCGSSGCRRSSAAGALAAGAPSRTCYKTSYLHQG